MSVGARRDPQSWAFARVCQGLIELAKRRESICVDHKTQDSGTCTTQTMEAGAHGALLRHRYES